ncbi:MAG TPA: periplasmic heavy metal sensor [Afifellaceae bacterium]|nr:periplasmic heavy metal sensor [Afifellaceae bacterium]
MNRLPSLGAAIAIGMLLLSGAALAEAAQPHQPYAELTSRTVKALSEQQIADLRAGRGMGLALAAELNGYPGPRHVLEHADALALSGAQRERTEALFEAMLAETTSLGEQLIRQETALDRLFASKSITRETLSATTGTIGTTQGALRDAHLRYHLAMMEVLTPEQVQRYNELRGYGRNGGHGHGHGGHGRL